MAAWLAAVVGPLPFHLVGVPLLLFFPDGRLPSRRWRWLAAPALVAVAVSVLATAFAPGVLPDSPEAIQNPFGLGGRVGSTLPLVAETAFNAVLLGILLAVASVIVRYRRAGVLVRQQIKWIALAGGLLVLAIVGGNVLVAVGISSWEGGGSLPILLVSAGIAAIPASIGIAVLRYRLYEIDRLVSRTVTYALVVGMLVAVYVGGVILLRSVFPLQGGLAVAASTLAVAALFNPLRKWVQLRVDRRFNRARYDAEQVVAALRERLRHEVDLDDVLAATRDAVARSVAPAHLSLWVRDTGAPR